MINEPAQLCKAISQKFYLRPLKIVMPATKKTSESIDFQPGGIPADSEGQHLPTALQSRLVILT